MAHQVGALELWKLPGTCVWIWHVRAEVVRAGCAATLPPTASSRSCPCRAVAIPLQFPGGGTRPGPGGGSAGKRRE